MKKGLKIVGSVFVALVIVTLITLRLTGLEPGYTGGDFTRPGLWLRGEVVRTPVLDWSFVNSIHDPVRKNSFAPDAPSLMMVETQTWYFIPHSVTTGVLVHNGQLYMHSHQGARGRGPIQNSMDVPFPKNKLWTANVARDPRVRIKIGGKVYEMTAVLLADRDEAAAILGNEHATRETGADGQERVTGYFHMYRLFQRNIPEYGGGSGFE